MHCIVEEYIYEEIRFSAYTAENFANQFACRLTNTSMLENELENEKTSTKSIIS